jgi:hypothetical protein
MKKLLPLCLLLVFCISNAQSQSRKKYDRTIAVIENVMPTEDRKPHDFFAVRQGDQYTLLFYTKLHKGEKASRVIVTSDKPYTHVSYKWLSGRKAAVRMFDANSKHAFALNVMGYRCGSGIEYEVDDEYRPIYEK